jgi:iron complex transport system ATP-binding protein
MIRFAHVSVRLGATDALQDVTLEVARGEWVALVGPNGAGKTTALRAVCGLVPYEGSVAVDGREVRTLGRRALARLAALVPQLPEAPPELTVAEYVLLGRTPHLGYFGGEGDADHAAALVALERLDAVRFARRALRSLSGGELQRVVLARALAQESPLLLLDEPTSALDLGRQQRVLELVEELRVDGLTILSTMHDLTLAGQYADRLVLVDRGAVVADGTPAEVLSEETISTFYGASVRVVHDEDGVFVLPRRTR